MTMWVPSISMILRSFTNPIEANKQIIKIVIIMNSNTIK